MTGGRYFGNIEPEEAWKTLAEQPRAALVDVRTTAEWAFVGTPDLSGAGGEVMRVEWQSYPAMTVNPRFVEAVKEALRAKGTGADDPVFFLCRSGGRSAAAATAMTAAGYRRCFNIEGGFEGAKDEDGHRGTIEGWKAAGLPWIQP